MQLVTKPPKKPLKNYKKYTYISANNHSENYPEIILPFKNAFYNKVECS